MISVHGTYQNGAVVLDRPVNLPEGTPVRVTLDAEAGVGVDLRSDGRPWPKTPEEIEAFLAEMDATPGIEISDEEYARIEAERRASKEEGIAETKKRMERIRAQFP